MDEMMKVEQWRKSSYSGNGGADCVEMARLPGSTITTRDSKDPNGPQHRFTFAEMAAFFDAVRQGRYDR